MSVIAINTSGNARNQCGYSVVVAPLVRDILYTYSATQEENPAFADSLAALQNILQIVQPETSGQSALEGLMSILSKCAKPGVSEISFDRFDPNSVHRLFQKVDFSLVQAFIADKLEHFHIEKMKTDLYAITTFNEVVEMLKSQYNEMTTALSAGNDVDPEAINALFLDFKINDSDLRQDLINWIQGGASDHPSEALRNRYFEALKGQAKDMDVMGHFYTSINAEIDITRQITSRSTTYGRGVLRFTGEFTEGAASQGQVVSGHYQSTLNVDPKGITQELQSACASLVPHASLDELLRSDVAVNINLTDPELHRQRAESVASDESDDSLDSQASTTTIVQETIELFSLDDSVSDVDAQQGFKQILQSPESADPAINSDRDHAIALAYQQALYSAKTDAEKDAVELRLFSGAGKSFSLSDRDAATFKTASVIYSREKQASSRPQSPADATPPV